MEMDWRCGRPRVGRACALQAARRRRRRRPDAMISAGPGPPRKRLFWEKMGRPWEAGKNPIFRRHTTGNHPLTDRRSKRLNPSQFLSCRAPTLDANESSRSLASMEAGKGPLPERPGRDLYRAAADRRNTTRLPHGRAAGNRAEPAGAPPHRGRSKTLNRLPRPHRTLRDSVPFSPPPSEPAALCDRESIAPYTPIQRYRSSAANRSTKQQRRYGRRGCAIGLHEAAEGENSAV